MRASTRRAATRSTIGFWAARRGIALLLAPALLGLAAASESVAQVSVLGSLVDNYQDGSPGQTSDDVGISANAGSWHYWSDTDADPTNGGLTLLTFGSTGLEGGDGFAGTGAVFNDCCGPLPAISDDGLYDGVTTPPAGTLAVHPAGSGGVNTPPEYLAIEFRAGADLRPLSFDVVIDNPLATGDGIDWSLIANDGTVLESGTQDGDSLSVVGGVIALPVLFEGESLWLVIGNGASDDPGADQTFVGLVINGVVVPKKGVDFDDIAPGTPLDSSTTLVENGYQYTQTLFLGGVDGSPEFVDAGGGDIGVEETLPGDYAGQTLEFTRVDGGIFTFDSIDAVNLVAGTSETSLQVDGYLGGTGGTLMGQELFFATPTPTTFEAVELAGKPVDTLLVSNIARPSGQLPSGNTVYTALELTPGGLAAISWTGPTAVSALADEQVLAIGETLVAESYAASPGLSAVLNGVTFLQEDPTTQTTIAAGLGGGASGYYSGANTALSGVLSTGFFDDGSGFPGFTVTIDGLTIGRDYVIQLFGGNDQPSAGNPVEVGNGLGDFGFQWGFPSQQDTGSFIVGSFTAQAGTQSFVVRRDAGGSGGDGGGAILSAINVREVLPPSRELGASYLDGFQRDTVLSTGETLTTNTFEGAPASSGPIFFILTSVLNNQGVIVSTVIADPIGPNADAGEFVVKREPGKTPVVVVGSGSPAPGGGALLGLEEYASLTDGGGLTFEGDVCPSGYPVGSCPDPEINMVIRDTSPVQVEIVRDGGTSVGTLNTPPIQGIVPSVGTTTGGFGVFLRFDSADCDDTASIEHLRLAVSREIVGQSFDVTEIARTCSSQAFDPVAGGVTYNSTNYVYDQVSDLSISPGYDPHLTVFFATLTECQGNGCPLVASSLVVFDERDSSRRVIFFGPPLPVPRPAISPQAINANGQVVYRETEDSQHTVERIVLYDYETDTTTTIAENNGPGFSLPGSDAGTCNFRFFGVPSINDRGDVAFPAEWCGGESIRIVVYEQDTGRLVDASGALGWPTGLQSGSKLWIDEVGAVSINNRKQLLYKDAEIDFAAQTFVLRLQLQTPIFRELRMQTTEVGAAGNAADVSGFGAVAERFEIGEHEVTNAQYAEFLNAVNDTAVSSGLYDPAMTSDPRGGIELIPGAPDRFEVKSGAGVGERPVNFVSWHDAARFTNWLNGAKLAPSAGYLAVTPPDPETGAYTPPTVPAAHDPAALWFLPSLDEWYKAAYHDPALAEPAYRSLPTATPPLPAGSCDADGNLAANSANYDGQCDHDALDGNLSVVGSGGEFSAWGTGDQGGNVREWTEPSGTFPHAAGGHWASAQAALEASSQSGTTVLETVQDDRTGFRVARRPLETVPFDSGTVPASNADERYVAIDLGSLPKQPLLRLTLETGSQTAVFLELAACWGGAPVASYRPFQPQLSTYSAGADAAGPGYLDFPVFHHYPSRDARRGAACVYRIYSSGPPGSGLPSWRLTADALPLTTLGSLPSVERESRSFALNWDRTFPMPEGNFTAYNSSGSGGTCSVDSEEAGYAVVQYTPDDPVDPVCCIWTMEDPVTGAVLRNAQIMAEEIHTAEQIAFATADGDADGSVNACDNCPQIHNSLQPDTDFDLLGNECDDDDDGDSLLDIHETGTGVYVSPTDTGTASLLFDSDGDGFGDGVEVAAGTDPTDAGDFPATSVPLMPHGALVTLFGAILAASAALRASRRRMQPGRAVPSAAKGA